VLFRSHHRAERTQLDARQAERWRSEQAARTARLSKGLRGLWDTLTGRQIRTGKQNEMEAFRALERDRSQRHDLIDAQLSERRSLQSEITGLRRMHAQDLLALGRDLTHYAEMEHSPGPALHPTHDAGPAFEP